MKRYLVLMPLIILVFFGLSFYLIKTVDINIPKGVIQIVHPEGIIDSGWFTRTYYMKYELLPTYKTEADVAYRVVVDNGLVRQENKIFWTQLELDIGKAKSIQHRISLDEFAALGLQPQYTMEVTEVRSERDVNYLMWSVIYIGILLLIAMSGVGFLIKPRQK